MRFRRALTAALVGAALLAAFPAYVQVRRGDAPPPEDDDLRVERPEVPDIRNALLPLTAAVERLDWQEEDDARWRELMVNGVWDADAASDLLARNRTALASVPEVLSRDRFQTPPFRRILDDLPDMLGWVRLSRLLALRAVMRAREDHNAAALEDALAPIRIGQLVQGEPGGVLIHAMIGVTLKDAGWHAFERTASHLALSREQARIVAAELAALRTDPAAWRTMWSAEYRVIRTSFVAGELGDLSEVAGDESREQAVAELELGRVGSWLLHRLPANYLFQANVSFQSYAARVRRTRQASASACAGLPALPSAPAPGIASLLAPNPLGELFNARAASQLRSYEHRRCHSDTKLAAAGALLALGAYERANDALPESLDALVPAWLDSLPRDGFDGRPLRYRREARLLHSIGSDLLDNGGRPVAEGEPPDREPRFPVPTPALTERFQPAAANKWP